MRINFYAGAGAGKSTTAAWLFSELKRQGHSVELILEYIKSWTYLERKPRSFDQVYVFGKQMQYEDKVVASGVKNVVCDSPVFLSPIYAQLYAKNLGISEHLFALAEAYDKVYPSISIFLARGNKPYKPEGRWGSRADAEEVDEMVLDFLKKREIYTGSSLLISDWEKRDEILDFVLRHIDS